MDKVWDRHVVRSADGEPDLLFIDLHLVHEVTSPQAFDGLRLSGRNVRRPDLTVATADHNVPTEPTSGRHRPGVREATRDARPQLRRIRDPRASRWATQTRGSSTSSDPSTGSTLPGMTIVCGDSHTSTHGAFGALAFGIGTSEVEHVLATQTLPQTRPKTMAVEVDGDLPDRCDARRISFSRSSVRSGPRAASVTSSSTGARRSRGPVHGRPDDRLQHVDRGRCACRA